jgi:hypothetical protein
MPGWDSSGESQLIYICVIELIAFEDAISHFYNVINEFRRRVGNLLPATACIRTLWD